MNETKSQLIPSVHWSPEFILPSRTLLLCLFFIFTYFLKSKNGQQTNITGFGLVLLSGY